MYGQDAVVNTSSYYNGLVFTLDTKNSFTYLSDNEKDISNGRDLTYPEKYRTDGNKRLLKNIFTPSSVNTTNGDITTEDDQAQSAVENGMDIYRFTLLEVTVECSTNANGEGVINFTCSVPPESKVRFNQNMINYQHIVSGPSQFTIDDGVL